MKGLAIAFIALMAFDGTMTDALKATINTLAFVAQSMAG